MPPAYIQEDFNEVFYSINNLEIDAAKAITSDVTSGNITNNNTVVTDPTNLDLDSINSL